MCLQEKKDENDRHSPEANAQQQMAAQRASGGTIDVPPEVNTFSNIIYNVVSFQDC